MKAGHTHHAMHVLQLMKCRAAISDIFLHRTPNYIVHTTLWGKVILYLCERPKLLCNRRGALVSQTIFLPSVSVGPANTI